jgi:hypothetical protein
MNKFDKRFEELMEARPGEILDDNLRFKALQIKDISTNIAKVMEMVMKGEGVEHEKFFKRRLQTLRNYKEQLDKFFEDNMNEIEKFIDEKYTK